MSEPRPEERAAAPGTEDDLRRRRRARLWLAFAVVVALVVAVVVVVRSRNADTADGPAPSRSAPTSPTAPAGTRPMRAGVTLGSALYRLSDAGVDRALDQVVALHASWIRIDLSWAEIQPRSAQSFDWSAVDTVVDAARERDLQVLGLLTYTPPWARARGCTSFVCPPRDTAEFATFAGAAARRYGPDRIGTFQVWNEPNLDLFWRAPDPSAYGRLLRATATALRAGADGLRILFGGLAYTGTNGTDDDGDIGPAEFLARACEGRRCPVDAVGFDPYTYPGVPSTTSRPLNAWQLMVNPAAGRAGLRTAMATVGLGWRAIWVTGFGAPTRFPGADSRRVVSPATQTRILVDGIRLAAARRDVLGGFFIDTLRDARTRGTLRDHFGLLTVDGTRKPAFRAVARELAR